MALAAQLAVVHALPCLTYIRKTLVTVRGLYLGSSAHVLLGELVPEPYGKDSADDRGADLSETAAPADAEKAEEPAAENTAENAEEKVQETALALSLGDTVGEITGDDADDDGIDECHNSQYLWVNVLSFLEGHTQTVHVHGLGTLDDLGPAVSLSVTLHKKQVGGPLHVLV